MNSFSSEPCVTHMGSATCTTRQTKCTHAEPARRALAFTYSALPWCDLPLIATKPLICNAFRAAATLETQSLMFLYDFLPLAWDFFDTTLPYLFLISMLLVRPEAVFSLPPRRTTALAKRPLAIMLTLFDFMTFIVLVFLP